MRFAVEILSAVLLLLALQELFRRSGRVVGWVFFGALPLVFTPHWIENSYHVGLCPQSPVFPVVKLYSMLFCACFATALRCTKLRNWRNMLAAAYWLMIVNLLEAMVRDLVVDDLAHWLNAAACGLLMITLPVRPVSVKAADKSGILDLHWSSTSRMWIVGYTLWNGVFVYLNFPDLCGREIAVLAAALLVGMLRPERWLQARTYTLAADLLILFLWPSAVHGFIDTGDWNNVTARFLGALASISFLAIYAGRLSFLRLRFSWNSRQQKIFASQCRLRPTP